MARRQRHSGQHSVATAPAAQFEAELEIFRTEVETALQFFYGYLIIHAVARDRKSVYKFLNSAPLFWNTNLGALQTATFITLGRIFDQDSAHNIDRLIGIAQNNLQIFSKQALGARKQGSAPTPPAWLPDYLKFAKEATRGDVRRWRSQVNELRKIYAANYRDLRHEVFAHRGWTDASQLFAKTNIRELQRVLLKLRALYEELWQLFFNGRKSKFRIGRYSIHMMRRKPSKRINGRPVHERIVHEAERVLRQAAGKS